MVSETNRGEGEGALERLKSLGIYFVGLRRFGQPEEE